jgi:hypothetical protein
MRDVGERQRLEFLDAVAENLRKPPVHVHETAVERRQRDPDRRLAEDGAKRSSLSRSASSTALRAVTSAHAPVT